MKNNLIVFVALLLLGIGACKEENYELGDPPTSSDATFNYAPTADNANIINFTAQNKDVVAVWDFGNGTEGKGITATASYPNKGTYTVTLTVFTKGGSASSQQDIVIVNDDLSLLSDTLFTLLTGGTNNPNGKTWAIDSASQAHFGVGPNPTGAAGNFPEYYDAGPNEKGGGGMYDDRYTFYLDAFKFDMVTNGDVYINAEQEANFPGASMASVGDFTAPFPDQIGESWLITKGADTTLTVSGNSFLGYYTGVNTYQIISISENELFLRYLDAADPDLSWYIRLVPEGYVSGGGGGGGGGQNTYSLPLDFESVEPVFTTFGNSSYSIINNPDKSGINTSNKVLETVHGNEVWAGLFVDLDAPLDFSSNKNIALKVYAPAAGTFRIKVENSGNTSDFVELDATVTQVNTWEEISIDFSSATPGVYDRLVLFPGWNIANAGTFYIDDIQQK